jgi:hypothetical protein
MMMSNILECERCRKQFIQEEFSSHICSPYLRGVKEIIVNYSYTIINQNGDKVTEALGLDDGISYRLVECKHNPIHRSSPRLRPPTKMKHLDGFDKTTEDGTEPKNRFSPGENRKTGFGLLMKHFL